MFLQHLPIRGAFPASLPDFSGAHSTTPAGRLHISGKLRLVFQPLSAGIRTMQGAFRYGKSICASLALAAAAFGAKYVQNFLFHSVGPAPSDGVLYMDRIAQSSHSLSAQRTSTGQKALWKIAVVTNRDVSRQGADRNGSLPPGSATQRSLADQVLDTVYSTAQTSFGFSDVSVPLARSRGCCSVDHENPACVRVNAMQPVDKYGFYESVAELVEASELRDIFVFVHGFNVTLDSAVARAAQMAEDMPFHGAMVVFSWQSQGKTEAYLTDEVLAERYFWNLAQLLSSLRERFPADVRLHLLAHSMGNRVALRALNALWAPSRSHRPAGRSADAQYS